MTLHTITWQSPSGKIVTSRPLTPTAARAEIEQNKQYTPDWRYTVEPPLDDLQTMLDAANARIAELEAVIQESLIAFGIQYASADKKSISVTLDWGGIYHKKNAPNDFAVLARLLDILPQKD